MDRKALQELWDAAWDGDIWIAPWTRAVEGVTPEQAAWQPAPGRHSIWQNVAHVCFWRDYTLRALAGQPQPSESEVAAAQFAAPPAPNSAGWAAAREKLAETHRKISAAIADPSRPLDRLKYHLAHDAYHLGQIMYVRAMLGLSPVV